MQLIISCNLLSEGQLDPLTGDGLGSRIVTVMLIQVKERNFKHREVMDDWLALTLGCFRACSACHECDRWSAVITNVLHEHEYIRVTNNPPMNNFTNTNDHE
jgi:hypothetical protein